MILNLLWIVVIIMAIISQYYIIEHKKCYPKKWLWFIIRTAVAGAFLYLYVQKGYMWYWALNYMIFSFWWPFNNGLALARGKWIGYLSPKNSFIDKMLLKVFRYENIVFHFLLIMMFISIGIMFFYGKVSWAEINNN